MVAGLWLTVLEVGSRGLEPTSPAITTQTLPPPDPAHSTPELAANLAEKQAHEPIRVALTPDPELGWMPAPTETQSNGPPGAPHTLGLRSPDPAPLEPGEIRLFALGDSSIWGTGVNLSRTFTVIAADALGQAWSRPTSGIVGGVPGHDSTQSRLLLERVGEDVAPSWLIVANMWSDLGRSQLIDNAPPTDLTRALQHIATYRQASRLLAPFLQERRIRFIASRADVGSGEATRSTQADYIADLRKMAAWAERHGAHVVFLQLPAPIDWDVAPPPETVTSFRACMSLVARETGAVLVDGPAYFKAHHADTSFFLDQVHPDDRGHYLLGQAVAAAIAAAGPPAADASTYAR